jgi:hypothetical protein
MEIVDVVISGKSKTCSITGSSVRLRSLTTVATQSIDFRTPENDPEKGSTLNASSI